MSVAEIARILADLFDVDLDDPKARRRVAALAAASIRAKAAP